MLSGLVLIAAAALLAVALYDLRSDDNILRNFPLVGHLRYWLIDAGPELRQYIVASNREEAPFNREERDWITRSARGENNYFGFGTDDQIYGIGYPIISKLPEASRQPNMPVLPDRAVVAFALGCDMVNVAREAMLSIGCIQAQKCHTDRCPAGIATQDPRLQRGVNVEVQSLRFARFCQTFRNELLAVTHACGYEHPSQFTADDVELSSGPAHFSTLRELFGYSPRREWKGVEGWSSHGAGEPSKLPAVQVA